MIDKELLKKVEYIQLNADRFVNSLIAGEYASAFRGRGLEFEEVREYVFGDDYRSIDWNVTSRAGKPHVKRFKEERNQKIYIMIDLSNSGLSYYSQSNKRDLFAQIAAVFSLASMRKQDAVGLILFSDQVELFIPPSKGSEHTMRIIRDILYYKPKHNDTNIRNALEYVNAIMSKSDSLIVLMSDFQDSNDFETSLAITAKHCQIITISAQSPFDLNLPNVGLLKVYDGENSSIKEIDTSSPSLRQKWQQKSLDWQQKLKTLFIRLNISYLVLDMAKPWENQVNQFLLNRIKNHYK